LYTAADLTYFPPLRLGHILRSQIPDAPPTDDEIAAAVQRLRNGKAPGPSGMRAEHLKKWAKDRECNEWKELAELVRGCFRTGQVPKHLQISTLVLIPKYGGSLRGIGLLEVVWKLISTIIKERLGCIPFDDALHGFRPGRGTGNATLRAKLLTESSLRRGTMLYQIFLDLKKAYDTLDRARTLSILEAYGMGPNLLSLLKTFWLDLKLVPRQSGFYGQPIKTSRGVTQGDPLSPMIFHLVVDCIVRCWRQVKLPSAAVPVEAVFYADDGWLASERADILQDHLDYFTACFLHVGLNTNAAKTKSLAANSNVAASQWSSLAYQRRMTGDGETASAFGRPHVECSKCGNRMQQRSLARHILAKHGTYQRPLKFHRLIDEDARPAVTYMVSLPADTIIDCPVPNCPGRAGARGALRNHFNYRHPKDIIVIEEEGLLPCCLHCHAFVRGAHSDRHRNSKRSMDGARRLRRRVLELEHLQERNHGFTVLSAPIEAVDTFRYLGSPLTVQFSDWPAMCYNLCKARGRWTCVSVLLRREGATPKVSGFFYKAIIQSVLLLAQKPGPLLRQW
jgi:Reverse transcriptase (RNA-dependent DNA polymerase)